VSAWFAANEALIRLLLSGLWETLQLTLLATLFSYLLGLPLGVLLVASDKGGIRENAAFNQVLGAFVNILRSVPFLILILMLFPVTRVVMGTTIGTRAAIFPLVISAFPYIARMVESSLREVDGGVIEAAQSMGATIFQIIYKVMLPESFPSLLNGLAISMTTILAYTAMAGAVGAGGLGKIAIDYGMYRFDMQKLYTASVLLVLMVQVIQVFGTSTSSMIDKRRK
jgi:D-methionine transport system permease protein